MPRSFGMSPQRALRRPPDGSISAGGARCQSAADDLRSRRTCELLECTRTGDLLHLVTSPALQGCATATARSPAPRAQPGLSPRPLLRLSRGQPARLLSPDALAPPPRPPPATSEQDLVRGITIERLPVPRHQCRRSDPRTQHLVRRRGHERLGRPHSRPGDGRRCAVGIHHRDDGLADAELLQRLTQVVVRLGKGGDGLLESLGVVRRMRSELVLHPRSVPTHPQARPLASG